MTLHRRTRNSIGAATTTSPKGNSMSNHQKPRHRESHNRIRRITAFPAHGSASRVGVVPQIPLGRFGPSDFHICQARRTCSFSGQVSARLPPLEGSFICHDGSYSRAAHSTSPFLATRDHHGHQAGQYTQASVGIVRSPPRLQLHPRAPSGWDARCSPFKTSSASTGCKVAKRKNTQRVHRSVEGFT